MQTKEKMSAKELAGHFKVSERTVTNWKNKGLLPPRKRIGGRFFWSLEDVEKFWEELGTERKPHEARG